MISYASYYLCLQNLWTILFQFRGSIWRSVLPYCLLNCLIMVGVEMLAYRDIKIAFSASGHRLMSLIISYLVVAKVNLGYDRYMKARNAIGHALACLRELNQTSMTYTSRTSDVARQWRSEGVSKIIDLMDCTIRVIQDEKQAVFLARNEFVEYNSDDPMIHVQALRFHLYKGCHVLEHPLELMEKMKLVDILNEYVIHYRNLLKLASTPLPFPLLQMARTFLFLYTFTIPFVLRGVVDEAFVAMIFVFFLTYGFVGLELVAIELMYPFGDDVNGLNVTGMREVRWPIESMHDLDSAKQLTTRLYSIYRLQYLESKTIYIFSVKLLIWVTGGWSPSVRNRDRLR